MALRAIKVYLNDSDPAEAAILAAWDACLPKRRSALVRSWLLGAQTKPRFESATPRPALVSTPAPQTDPKDIASALEAATNSFLNTFGA